MFVYTFFFFFFGQLSTYHVRILIPVMVLADIVLVFLLLLFDFDFLLHQDGELDLGVPFRFCQLDNCCVNDCGVFIILLAAAVFSLQGSGGPGHSSLIWVGKCGSKGNQAYKNSGKFCEMHDEKVIRNVLELDLDKECGYIEENVAAAGALEEEEK